MTAGSAGATRPRRGIGSRALRALCILLLAIAIGETAIRLATAVLAARRAGLGGPRDGVIYAIGDSFTYGTGVERHEAWPAVLEDLLREAGIPLRVVNNGWPGLSSANAVYAVQRVLEDTDPALVVVMTGWNANDTDFARLRESRDEASRLDRLDDLLDSSRLYRVLKQALTYRSRTAEFGSIELVPQAPQMDLYDFRDYQLIARRNLERIASLCRRAEAPLILLNYPYQRLPDNPWGLEYEYYHLVFGRSELTDDAYLVPDREAGESALHAVIRDSGDREGVPVVDLHAHFEKASMEGLFQPDWHHPTSRGHQLIARAIFEHIEENYSGPTPSDVTDG